MKFVAIVHKEETGGYWAEVPTLPGCCTQGETLEELENNLREAITVYLKPDSSITANEETLEVSL
ncbi:MAG: type II toxin-antitoxin system HicB family antitoxin [Candidatus Caenarcaniphilales bacterium]|nr:type II toxin-antitoxin system HicB family antitoxin [Candidatus Caenarcaniphilales bacterium]